ncbi:MAG: hypothetical protein ABLQ96_10985, partial [Candidatus Acidiferrum sp.]
PLKNWRELYLAALVEIDPEILKRKVEVALQSVERRTQELKDSSAAPTSEQQALRDAASALKSLMRAS